MAYNYFSYFFKKIAKLIAKLKEKKLNEDFLFKIALIISLISLSAIFIVSLLI
ncbi:MAG: hypothetical protein QXR96_03145 [Candidatus Woesearchaeota archaeon]